MENRNVHSRHGCMIITDSSVIEDLLTAFHYQQHVQSERVRRKGGMGRRRKREEALRKHSRRAAVVVVIGAGGGYHRKAG